MKSTARRSKGASDRTCEQLLFSRAHSERLRSVRGCGTSHNRRTMAGQPAADEKACPEWRRRREQQHKCALGCRELSPRSCFTSRLRSLPGRGAKFAYGCVRYQSTSASSSLRHRGNFSRLRSKYVTGRPRDRGASGEHRDRGSPITGFEPWSPARGAHHKRCRRILFLALPH